MLHVLFSNTVTCVFFKKAYLLAIVDNLIAIGYPTRRSMLQRIADQV